jgi:5'-3' exonuclease
VTRRELNQIYYINREIEMWQRELDDITSLQSPKLDGIPKGTGISDSTAAKAVKAAPVIDKINELLAELQIKRQEIYEYIATIDDSLMRQIILYRCLSLCTWKEVATYVGGGNTADSVRMMFMRFTE